jgi:hypothetical protein
MGKMITTSTNTTAIIVKWFYFFIKNEGRAIPTLKE